MTPRSRSCHRNPQSLASGLPGEHQSIHPHTEDAGVAVITWMEVGCRMSWYLIRFFTGYCCLQHGIFVSKGRARRLAGPQRETESVGSIKGEGGGKERSIFARLQLYSSFRGQEWGSLQSKTTEVWQAGIPLALLSACRQAAQFLWHTIAAVSWWRSFQSLGFPVLSWQQLLSRSCWNPFSHSVNATHRKVGCSHQSPSLSLRFDWLRIGRGAVLLQAWLIFHEHDGSFILQERFEELWIANRVLIAQQTNTLSVINICH